MRIVIFAVMSILLPLLWGCSGSGYDNWLPVVKVDPRLSVAGGAEVVLDGSASWDKDGSIVRYRWRQTGGEPVSLEDADQARARFTAPAVRKVMTLTFSLTVTDDDGGSSSDTLEVVVRPAASTAAFGLEMRPSNPDCVAPARPLPRHDGVELQPAFSGLVFQQPVAMLQAPGDARRWYVVERGGYVRTFVDTDASATTFADLTDRVLAPSFSWSEQGLLGMAFHPRFTENRYVFLSYTRQPDGASVISRFLASQDGLTLDPASERVVLTVPQPAANHNGGGIAFGPDGFLYIGLGDGGGSGDPDNNAQNTGNLLGAMLRIDVDGVSGERAYSIPSDNPFASSRGCDSGEGCPEIWAWGLRNPWRWSFDRETGKLWAGDVGQDKWEEVNVIEKSGNYGWRCFEGMDVYRAEGCGARDDYLFPETEYGHDDEGGNSITGGYVYRGKAIPALQGYFLYGDFGTGSVWAFPVEGGESKKVLETALNIASFAEGHDGELYLLDYKGGTLHKIVPKGDVQEELFPQKLSQTGCFLKEDPTRPVEGLIPYGVNAPLWSDNAEKRRWFAIPDGTTIRIGEDGNNWIFPRGSVLIKEFRLNGKRIETRLLVRHDDGKWAGYSYEWDAEGRDATLLPGAKSKRIGNQVWDYPSRAQCLFCHTEAAGYALGLETVQLNGLFTYPHNGEVANQLATLEHVGMFDGSLPGRPEELPALVDFLNPGYSPAERAEAYLYANCANCHRPGAIGLMDLSYGTPLAEMGICNAEPQQKGVEAGSGARLLVPGHPERSILVRRMKSTGPGRMPMIGTRLVDETGVGVMEAWIRTIENCPE